MTTRQSFNNGVARLEVERMLRSTPAFHQLDRSTQAELAESMSKIADFLSNQPMVSQLAPVDLRQRLSPQGQQGAAGGQGSAPAGNAPIQPAQPQQNRGATARVGEVARATLGAIDFPEFVSSLIKGTFQAIVDASIQQMEAYAELLKNVARTVDQFMEDNVTEDMAKDYLSDRYSNVFTRDTSAGQPQFQVNSGGFQNEEMPSFLRDMGFESPDDIDDEAVQNVIIPQTRRTLAEQRQQTLATMVLMGINRVVVDDGEITAKLQFHIDASESMGIRFDNTKTTVGNMAGSAARNMYSGNAIMVNTSSMNAQSDINVRADLTGQVKVKFRSETFPLERFADSAAIQFINQQATVPQPTAAPPGPEQPAQAAPVSQPAVAQPAPAPAATPLPPPPPAPAAQSLSYDDPWAPKG